jgi:hypothetical protein
MLLQDLPETTFHHLPKECHLDRSGRGFSDQALAAPNNRPLRAAKPLGYERSKNDITSLVRE